MPFHKGALSRRMQRTRCLDINVWCWERPSAASDVGTSRLCGVYNTISKAWRECQTGGDRSIEAGVEGKRNGTSRRPREKEYKGRAVPDLGNFLCNMRLTSIGISRWETRMQQAARWDYTRSRLTFHASRSSLGITTTSGMYILTFSGINVWPVSLRWRSKYFLWPLWYWASSRHLSEMDG